MPETPAGCPSMSWPSTWPRPAAPPGGGLRRMGAQMMFNDFLERYFSFLAV